MRWGSGRVGMRWGEMREMNESRLVVFLLGIIIGLVTARVFDYLTAMH
jgi:hypothetical protein